MGTQFISGHQPHSVTHIFRPGGICCTESTYQCVFRGRSKPENPEETHAYSRNTFDTPDCSPNSGSNQRHWRSKAAMLIVYADLNTRQSWEFKMFPDVLKDVSTHWSICSHINSWIFFFQPDILRMGVHWILMSPLKPVSPFLLGSFEGQKLSFPRFILSVLRSDFLWSTCRGRAWEMCLLLSGPVLWQTAVKGLGISSVQASVASLFQYVRVPFQWMVMPLNVSKKLSVEIDELNLYKRKWWTSKILIWF